MRVVSILRIIKIILCAKRIIFNCKICTEEKICGLDFSSEDYSDKNHLAISHQSISPFYFYNLLKNAVEKNQKEAVFVDLGCGKGRACFLAERYFKFKKVIGVDISSKWIYKAKNNQKKIRHSKITFIVKAAESFKLPKEFCIVYMFNPFNSNTLHKFITNNFAHFDKFGSLIVYANDVNRIVFYKLNFFNIYRSNKASIWSKKHLSINTQL